MKTHRDLKLSFSSEVKKGLKKFHENPQGFETIDLKGHNLPFVYFMKTHRDLKLRDDSLDMLILIKFHENPQGFETRSSNW